LNTIAHRIIALFVPALFALGMGFSSARAESGDKIETSYDVNVRGVTVLKIRYSSEISAAGYRSQASIKTRGVVTFFSDYRMRMEALGVFADGQSSPQQYTSRSEKNDKEKNVELNWSKGALAASDRQATKNPEIQADIDAALASGVTDPLTAIFRIGTSRGGNPCQAAHRIFDGKEVFELRFSFEREAVLDDSFPGAYHGKAYECGATYVPVAGRYATKFRKSKEDPETYTVWLAPIGSDASGGTRLIPVRATGRLDGIKFEAFASRLKIDDRPFKKIPATVN
jgi:uncharacterized protein DUF3108